MIHRLHTNFKKPLHHIEVCIAAFANNISPLVMTNAKLMLTYERFPICDDKITENDRCVIKKIGILWYWFSMYLM